MATFVKSHAAPAGRQNDLREREIPNQPAKCKESVGFTPLQTAVGDSPANSGPNYCTVRSPRQTASTDNIGSRTGEKVSESPTESDQTFNPPDDLSPSGSDRDQVSGFDAERFFRFAGGTWISTPGNGGYLPSSCVPNGAEAGRTESRPPRSPARLPQAREGERRQPGESPSR